jgi:hypothetical protein
VERGAPVAGNVDGVAFVDEGSADRRRDAAVIVDHQDARLSNHLSNQSLGCR